MTDEGTGTSQPTAEGQEANGYQTDWPTEAVAPQRKGDGPFTFFRELPVLIVIAFGLALLMKTFLIQAFFIPSESMEPTLWGHSDLQTGKKYNDRVLVNKLVYRFRDPKRGEVIVFIAHHNTQKKSFPQKVKSFLFEGLGVTNPPDVDFIKRVIGLPGDTLQVTQKGVTITPAHGKKFKLFEPYIKHTAQHPLTDNESCGKRKDCTQGPDQPPFKVPADRYFVMGDNRGNSSDSRSSLGTIKRSDIIGKAFVKIWPPKRMSTIHTPSYCTDPREHCPKSSGASVPVGVVLLSLGARTIRRRRAA